MFVKVRFSPRKEGRQAGNLETAIEILGRYNDPGVILSVWIHLGCLLV
jgi:hypothetical protein